MILELDDKSLSSILDRADRQLAYPRRLIIVLLSDFSVLQQPLLDNCRFQFSIHSVRDGPGSQCPVIFIFDQDLANRLVVRVLTFQAYVTDKVRVGLCDHNVFGQLLLDFIYAFGTDD
jgi:hypothetical protein